MTATTKNHELVKSLNWLSTGNPNVADAQRAMVDAAKAITLLEEHTDKLVENVGEATLKYQEQEREYILPQFQWAKAIGIDLEKLVTTNPGKNCSQLLFEALVYALQESLKLQSHYAGLLNQYDQEGQRLQFSTVRAWIQRLQQVKKGTGQPVVEPEPSVSVTLDYEADQKTGDVRIVKRPANPEPIPCGVYFSEEHLNFYNFQTGKGMGQLFFNKWIDRQSEFARKP